MTYPVRHASRSSADEHDDGYTALCGVTNGLLTEPKETVNCPACRVILNHVRNQYPQHANYTDWRLTPEQEKRAARDFASDAMGGTDD